MAVKRQNIAYPWPTIVAGVTYKSTEAVQSCFNQRLSIVTGTKTGDLNKAATFSLKDSSTRTIATVKFAIVED